jgi:low affinity Fe/Cu permease
MYYSNLTLSYPNVEFHYPSLTFRHSKPTLRYTDPTPISTRRLALVLGMMLLAVTVAIVTLAAGHVELLSRMPIFQGATPITGVTEFLDKLKGYLISIVLAGFTVAGIAVGAAKLTGHSRANDMIFNTGIGIAIFAALPTLVA